MYTDIISDFTEADTIQDMPHSELCSECYGGKLALRQSSPYSSYDSWYEGNLEFVNKQCGVWEPTAMQPSLDTVEDDEDTICVSGKTYTPSSEDDTCEKVAISQKVSPVGLYNLNPKILKCSSLPAGEILCLPLACDFLVEYPKNSACTSLEAGKNPQVGDLRRFSPWINFECSNLDAGGEAFGWALFTAPQNGQSSHTSSSGLGDTVTPHPGGDYTPFPVDPPQNTTVPEGTTAECGRWHVVKSDDSCATICMGSGVNIDLLLTANPSLGTDLTECSAHVTVESVYCTGPTYEWAEKQ